MGKDKKSKKDKGKNKNKVVIEVPKSSIGLKVMDIVNECDGTLRICAFNYGCYYGDSNTLFCCTLTKGENKLVDKDLINYIHASIKYYGSLRLSSRYKGRPVLERETESVDEVMNMKVKYITSATNKRKSEIIVVIDEIKARRKK